MVILAWVLILYTGGHTGYITVPDIFNQSACERLFEAISPNFGVWGGSHKCIEYLSINDRR